MACPTLLASLVLLPALCWRMSVEMTPSELIGTDSELLGKIFSIFFFTHCQVCTWRVWQFDAFIISCELQLTQSSSSHQLTEVFSFDRYQSSSASLRAGWQGLRSGLIGGITSIPNSVVRGIDCILASPHWFRSLGIFLRLLVEVDWVHMNKACLS